MSLSSSYHDDWSVSWSLTSCVEWVQAAAGAASAASAAGAAAAGAAAAGGAASSAAAGR